MSVFLYDMAMEAKFKKIFLNTVMSPFEAAFEDAARDEVDATITFPLLGITRLGWKLDSANWNNASFFDGKYETADDNHTTGFKFPMLPILINYQLDTYASTREEDDRLAAELAFFIIGHPNLSFRMTRPIEWYVDEAVLKLDDINEQSEFGNFLDKGRLYRTTFELSLNQAFLYQVTNFNWIETWDITLEVY